MFYDFLPAGCVPAGNCSWYVILSFSPQLAGSIPALVNHTPLVKFIVPTGSFLHNDFVAFRSTLGRSIGFTKYDVNKTDITHKLINVWIFLKYIHKILSHQNISQKIYGIDCSIVI